MAKGSSTVTKAKGASTVRPAGWLVATGDRTTTASRPQAALERGVSSEAVGGATHSVYDDVGGTSRRHAVHELSASDGRRRLCSRREGTLRTATGALLEPHLTLDPNPERGAASFSLGARRLGLMWSSSSAARGVSASCGVLEALRLGLMWSAGGAASQPRVECWERGD